MKRLGVLGIALVVGLLASFACGDTVSTHERSVTTLADGVYVIRHADAPDGNLNGNTTVIVGDRLVLVVDSCFQPSAAAEDIAQIRRWTPNPVAFVVNTHWHNDHNMGNGLYRAAFPFVEIVAHTYTAEDMYRTPGTASRFVQQIAKREQRLATGKSDDGTPLTPEQIVATRKSLEGKRQMIPELRSAGYQAPTLTFERELTVDLGNREVRIMHLGRGPTRGDTIVYLPKENIVVAGDLLTHPVLFTYDGYPSEWAQTLERIAELPADTFVPGHGEVLHGKEFLNLSRDLLRSAVEQVHRAFSELTSTIEYPSLEQISKQVDLSAFRSRFAGTDQEAGETFDDATAALVHVAFNEALHNTR